MGWAWPRRGVRVIAGPPEVATRPLQLFLGLNQVRRVADEVRLQALRTKKVLDPGSVPLELVVSV